MIFQTKMFNLSHFASRAQINLATCSFGGNSENINCAGHKIELHKLNHTGKIKSGQVRKKQITFQFQKGQILQHQQVRGLPLRKKYHAFFEEEQKANQTKCRVLKLQKDSDDELMCEEKSS